MGRRGVAVGRTRRRAATRPQCLVRADGAVDRHAASRRGAIALSPGVVSEDAVARLGLAPAVARERGAGRVRPVAARSALPRRRSSAQLEQRARSRARRSAKSLRDHWRRLLIAGGARIGPDVHVFAARGVPAVSYITTTLWACRARWRSTALAIGAAFNVVFILVAGVLSDRFGRRVDLRRWRRGRRRLVVVRCFRCWIRRSSSPSSSAFVSGLCIHAFMYGPQAAFIAEQFPTRVRYAGASLAYTLGRRVRRRHRAAGVPGVVSRVWNAAWSWRCTPPARC